MMEVNYILSGLCALLAAVYYYLTFWYGYWKRQGLPTVKGTVPGLGNMWPILFLTKNVSHMAKDFYDQMTGYSMAGLYNFRKPALLVRDPEVVKSVLQTNFSSFVDNDFSLDPELDPLLSENPFFANGEQWRDLRKQLSFAFTSARLKYMYQGIDGVCTEFVNYLNRKILKEGGSVEVELKELFSRYTAEVVAVTAFGVEGDSFKDEENGSFGEMGKLMFESSTQLITLLMPFLRKLLKSSFMPAEVDKFFRKIVHQVLKHRTEENIQRNDFLQLMIQYRDSGIKNNASGGEFNENTITAHATSFFFDGYETSSITLSFVAYQLSKYPEIQQRVREEVDAVAKKHNGITYEALQEMTYTDQVLNESMRLFPALGVFLKICTKEIDLQGSDGISCRVTPGTSVVIPVYGLHNDPEYWPEPDKFDPERFSQENNQTRPKFAYLPFGEGSRICVGMRMGILQMKAAIAVTIKNFILEFSPRTQEPIRLNPNSLLSIAVGGLWIKLTPL